LIFLKANKNTVKRQLEKIYLMYLISLLKPKVGIAALFLWNISLAISWYFFGKTGFGITFGILCIGIGGTAFTIRENIYRISFFYLVLEDNRELNSLKNQLKISGLFLLAIGFATLLSISLHFIELALLFFPQIK